MLFLNPFISVYSVLLHGLDHNFTLSLFFMVGCCVVLMVFLYYFMLDMLENHEDDEDRPQKKKRKLSSSQENNNNSQDISFIKVSALSTALILLYILYSLIKQSLSFITYYKLHIFPIILLFFRTSWSHSPLQSLSDWRELNQSYTLLIWHAKPLDANWIA